MANKIFLKHITNYTYSEMVNLSSHEIRLKPAPHCKVNIEKYSIEVYPKEHYLNWQQDPFNNYLAQIVVPNKTDIFYIEVNLIANLNVINPFDFFLKEEFKKYPVMYDNSLREQLSPFLSIKEQNNTLLKFINTIEVKEKKTLDLLMDINRLICNSINYVVRLEPGVQSCEYTLKNKKGSCRDMSWLMCQVLRYLGFASRFTSGYLIQLKSDNPKDGGPEEDFADLHAWVEVYLPGSGWIGFDPTSGLMAGEGHIPLCSTPEYQQASPVTGSVDRCETTLDFSLSVTRLEEKIDIEKPYCDSEFKRIKELGEQVDADLNKHDVRLTMGGEPTFVAKESHGKAEWNTKALGEEKFKLSFELLLKLKRKFANQGAYALTQGKWYSGEELPRWAMNCFWRKDGEKIWSDTNLLADYNKDYQYSLADAKEFIFELAEALNIVNATILEAIEKKRAPSKDDFDKDIVSYSCVGYVLPLVFSRTRNRWCTNFWKKNRKIQLMEGTSSIGYRLPLDRLPASEHSESEKCYEQVKLPSYSELLQEVESRAYDTPVLDELTKEVGVVRYCLGTQVRDGKLFLFIPPVERLKDYLDLLVSIEYVARKTNLKVVIEGYIASGLGHFSITPDPGVVEVNIHPSSSWNEMVNVSQILYQSAEEVGLVTEKFMQDGTPEGTGGGSHIVLGGKDLDDSPFLRRPDLLKSLIIYWQNHPSLSYLFSGKFVGPTCQAPRVDEARHDSLYELEIAFSQIENKKQPYWLIDRLLRNLLVDVTGNTHRAEFCIDKLYSPTSFGRQGLVEFRAFEMPCNEKMYLVQILLLRSLVSMLWQKPLDRTLTRFGTALHDKYMLPYCIWNDFKHVIEDLNDFGYDFNLEWFLAFFEFKFIKLGTIQIKDIKLELRRALEPWNVLGEDDVFGATSRGVDSATERLQICVNGIDKNRYMVICNGKIVPLHSTGINHEYIAGVRYKAWSPPFTLHPNLPVNTPLEINIVDIFNKKVVGGCTYHVSHPGGLSYEDYPLNAKVAESRRNTRFLSYSSCFEIDEIELYDVNPEFPYTLDLRTGTDIKKSISHYEARLNKAKYSSNYKKIDIDKNSFF